MSKLWWSGRLLTVIAAALLAGCQPLSAPGYAPSPPPRAALLPPAPTVRVGADEIRLLRSGPTTFAALRTLIDAAHVSVHVEVYKFGNHDLIQAVEAAHQRGVAVTVIDDPSEINSAATAIQLRSQGVDVVDYPVRRLMMDPVKLLVVDGAVAVVGEITCGVRPPANHAYDAEVRGPVVANLDRVFM